MWKIHMIYHYGQSNLVIIGFIMFYYLLHYVAFIWHMESFYIVINIFICKQNVFVVGGGGLVVVIIIIIL
jgi:hypothetical protein